MGRKEAKEGVKKKTSCGNMCYFALVLENMLKRKMM